MKKTANTIAVGLLAMLVGLSVPTPTSTPATAPASLALERFELAGSTGDFVTTTIHTSAPTLLQAFREDWTSVSNIGSIRIGFRPTGVNASPNLPAIFPTAWVNGDLWLPSAGSWDVTVWSEAEDRTPGVPFTLLYAGVCHPDEAMLDAARGGIAGGRPAYHFETLGGTWDQVMKLEQRLIAHQSGTLSIRCGSGAIRYRWGGPPSGNINSEGGSYDVLQPGETLRIEPMPLASLWLRADNPTCPVEINWVSQRIR